MSNMGIGIGSFIQGLANGANVARQWDKQDQEAKFKERQLSILENADKRATAKDSRDAANQDQDRQWKAEDRSANAPILAAQRRSALGALSDADAEKEAKKSAGEEATAAFKSDPNRYGSVTEAYRQIAVPKVKQFYLSQGDTAKADAFEKWANDKRIENGIETVGKLEQSFQRGDWDAVSKHYNSLMSDGAYVPQTGFKYSAEPIKGKDGKVVGLRATTTSPDGESANEDFTDITQVHQKLMPMISPQTMFEFGKHQYEQEQATKAERAKSQNKLVNDITLEGVKNQNQADLKRMEIAGKIAEERAKALGPQGIKDYANGVLQVMKLQSENNAGFAKLPPEQQASQAAQIYEQVRARSGQGGGQAQQVPTSRTMQPQQQAPTKTPMARSIMPSFAPPGPFIPET